MVINDLKEQQLILAHHLSKLIKNLKMNVLIIFLTIVFLFLMTFGGTILGKVMNDYRILSRETFEESINFE